MRTHWDPLHHAYFGGYALWTALTTPFLLEMDGFEVREIAPWHEGAEVWRGLRATFPAAIASHSTEQDFYFGPDMLIRRHDYRVEVAGGFPAAEYVSDTVSVNGIKIPTKRRAYLRDERLAPMLDTLMISVDLSVSGSTETRLAGRSPVQNLPGCLQIGSLESFGKPRIGCSKIGQGISHPLAKPELCKRHLRAQPPGQSTLLLG